MVSFRKIVNVLVLIAYVKMTLVSSFAMDAPFHNATRAFKVTLEPTLGRNGEVQAMKLRLIQQDRSGEGKAERLLTQAEINVTHNTYTPNLKLITRNGTPWFVWRLPQFGVIQIDQNGNMLLEGINQHHPATILKIKTSHLIMLHNCAIHNLHLTGHAAHLKGNNIFGNLKANLGLTLTTLRDRQEQLRNLILKNGRFVNWSTINWQGGGIWNLRGNSLVNQGTLNLEEGAQTLQQALLVSNLGRIQGRQLNITTHNFHNLGTMDLASLWLYARHNLINQGQIHSRHQSHYQFGQDFKNSGQINSEGSFLITSIQDQGTLTNIGEIQAHQSRFENLKLVNHHELTLQNSDWQTVNVENTGRFLLGHIDPATQSVIPTLTNQGYMAGTGTLTVAEDGENTGELQLSDAELILPDSVFDNQGTIWLSRLSGNGQFFNRGTYCTATTDAKAVLNIRDFHNDFPGARLQGGRVEGQENLWNFVTDHASTIELVSLIFHKVGRAGSPFNDLKGTVNVDFLKLDQSPVKLLGTLAAKMVQITNGSLLVTESGSVTASTSILDQVQLTNEGRAELGEVRLSQTEITNKGRLRAAVERADQASRIDNEGVFETRFNLEHDGAYQYQHYFFEKYLHNSGQVTVLGDYRPRTEKRDESPILHLLTYEGEPIRVTGTLYLPLLDLYVGYHFLKDKIRPARLLIEAQGEDVVFDIEDADWSFAKQVHIRNGRHVVFKQPTTVNHLRLEAIDKVFVDRLLHLIYGDLTTQDVTYFYVGRDNDHMAEIQADAGAIDIEGHYLIDARYGKLRSRGRLSLRAPQGKIQVGERIVVPISEIKQRITNNPYELKGFCKSFNHSGEEFAEFYLPNGSHLISDQGALNLRARDTLDFNFASIFAGAGLYTQSSFLNWLNVHGIVLGEWQDQSQKVLYHRTPSHVIEGDVYKYALQTSEVTRLLIMGNCTSTTPAFEVIGADILIAGGICLNGQHYTSGEEIKRHHKVAALEHCCRLRDGYQMNLTCNSSDLQRAVLFRAVVARRNEWRCLQGTSGGTLMCGQGLSLTRDDLICVGGGVTAQLIDVNLNSLHLEALRATLPRVALPTVGLDKTTERLAKDNPVIQRTERGTLTMDPQGAMPTETKTAPFWDERAQRFTTTYPTNVPFYLDNALEAIAFTEQMNVNTGRLNDDYGHSGDQLLHESIRRAQALATQGAPITEQTLKNTTTCLLFYRLQKINGQEFLVATAHIPQTLHEDQVNASGLFRGEQIHGRIKTINSQGGRTAATGTGTAMTVETETKQASSVHIGDQIIRPSEAVERGNLRQAVKGDVKEEGLISTVGGNRSVRVDGNLTQTNCQNNASKATTVEVSGKATLQSSSITSDKGPTYFKAAALEMEILLDTIYTHNGYYQRPRADTVLGSQNAGLFVNVAGDMKATGALFRGTSIDLHAEGPREFGATPMHGRTEEVGIKDTTIREWCTHLLPRLEVTQATETAADPAPRILGSALPCLSRDSDSLTDYYENPVSTEGNDCAFNCLGISRNEAVVLLLEQKYNEEARRLVAPEIRLAYIAGDLDRLPGFANMPAYQSLKAYLGLFQSLTHLFKTQLRSALGLTENQSWRDAYTVIQRHNLQAQYPEFMEKANHYLNFDAELRAFSELPEVYERYLYRYLGTNEMMGYQPDQFDARLGVWKRSSSAFDLLTRLLGQKLQIMFKNKQTGAFELIHEDDFDGEPITLLHTLAGVEGGHAVLKEETETKLNHFNVLLTENEQQDFSCFYDHKAAEGQAYISSGGNAFDQGLQTQALKGVIKRSGGALIETTVQNWMREQTITRKKKWNGKNKTEENTHFTLQNQGCTTITKENDVEYYAAQGIALQASIIRARKIRLQTAEGVIKLLTALNVDCVETKKRSKDAVWQCQSQTFDYNETRLPCQFFYNEEDGIEFIAPQGIVVELVQEKHSRADGDVDKGKPREWQRFKDYSTQPGYEWMKLLDARDDVIRIYVDERHDSGRFASQGMTAAAKIVLSLILTIMTGGGGLAALSTASVTQMVTGVVSLAVNSMINSMIVNTIDQRGQVDKAAKATFSKESLKGLGVKLLAQVLLQGGSLVAKSMTEAATKTAAEAATQTATQAATQVGTQTAAEAASWTKQLQEAFCESLKTGMANTVASGIVYGNWREQLKEAGINLVTDTAAHFGAAQIGGKRWKEIEADLKAGKTDIFNYVSHKVTHAALGAATRAAAAKLKGADSKQVRKAAKGGAVGAAAAEIVAEQMMPKTINSIETQLGEEGLRSGTRRYFERKQELLSTELIRIKAYGQIAAVLTAKAVGGDIHAAQEAAINAMTFNTTQVYEGLATHLSAATEDPFTEVFEQNSRPPLKKSKSFTEQRQLYEMEIVESVDQAVRDDALNSDSIFKKFLYYASTAIGEVEGTTPMHAHRDRSQIRRAYKDAPKVYRESKALLQDLWHGRSIDDSRLDAYNQLFGDWAANCTGVMSGFVGGGKFGRGRASWMRTPHQQAAASGHLRPGIPLYNPANQNRAPAGTQRSANANRLYEDMRAVANGGNTHRSAFSDLGARTAGTKFGMPERMSGEQWINRSTNVPSMSSGSSGSSTSTRVGAGSTSTDSSTSTSAATSFGSGNPTSDKRVNGPKSKLGRTLDGKEERKGKEREGGPRSSANSNPSTIPNISENHDRVAHDGYYTRKNERTDQHNWQQRIKNAKPADYKKHKQATTDREAKDFSSGLNAPSQYLPHINVPVLEREALKKGKFISQPGGSDYVYYRHTEPVGYSNGKPTNWVRVEITKHADPIYHGHPRAENLIPSELRKG